MLPPQKFREIVFQLLYSHDFSPLEIGESVPFMMGELKVTKRSMMDAHARVGLVLEKLSEIDARLQAVSTVYSFERISRVERTLLRLGLFELFYDETIPPAVAIAEAIRLCRKFGTRESAQFVNAILDRLHKEGFSALAKEPVSV
jgi:N utilization substance protein B